MSTKRSYACAQAHAVCFAQARPCVPVNACRIHRSVKCMRNQKCSHDVPVPHETFMSLTQLSGLPGPFPGQLAPPRAVSSSETAVKSSF